MNILLSTKTMNLWKISRELPFVLLFIFSLETRADMKTTRNDAHSDSSNAKQCSELLCSSECPLLRSCHCIPSYPVFLMTCSKFSLPLTIHRRIGEVHVSCQNANGTRLNKGELEEILSLFTSLQLSSVSVNFCCGSSFLDLVKVSNNNMLKTTNFTLQNNCLNSVEGNMTYFFPNLNELNLSNNNLSDLMLSNSFLDSLILNKNQFAHLKRDWFRNFKELTVLSLNENYITTLPEDTFFDLLNLKTLILSSNRLTHLPSAIFKQNKDLETLDLSNNQLQQVSPDLLSNLTFLKNISLSSNKFSMIPETFLKGLTQLKEIYLQNNYLEYIPDTFFIYNLELDVIRLDNNRITTIPLIKRPYFYPPLEINLSQNRLKILEIPLIKRIQAATRLDMSDNCFSEVHENTVTAIEEHGSMIEHFICSNCCLTEIHPLLSHKLEGSLNLSHNLITEINNQVLIELIHFTVIDLSYNTISNMNINVSDPEFKKELSKYFAPAVNLNYNPVHCDCHIKQFLQYIQNQRPFTTNVYSRSLHFNVSHLICKQPGSLKGKLLYHTLTSELFCQVVKDCPDKCGCSKRASDGVVMVDCSQKRLKQFPKILPSASTIYLDLSLNEILTLPAFNSSIWFMLTTLNLSNNKIESLTNLTLTPKLQQLFLHNNKLQTFESQLETILQSKTLQYVSLYGNPWICDCSLVTLKHLMQNTSVTLSTNGMVCDSRGKKIFIGLMVDNQFCSSTLLFDSFARVLFPLLTAVLLFVCLAIYFGWKYRDEIKLWLFIHQWLLYFVTEKDNDEDLLYDAFISYSDDDGEWVAKLLVPGLETGPPAYKLCLHDRDWPLGECVIQLISNSIQQSRRTIVVLTTSYLQNHWSRMEFAVASQQSLSNHVKRILVVVPGEVPNLDLMDEEFRTFITMNTYLKWDDPQFWKRLRCAMPRVRQN